MAEFPKKAKVVIVGLGGIVGASIAHHLIERGWDDIVGIDKSGIPTDIGSTAHASDFCYATSHDFLSCWTTLYSIDFYEKLGHYARVGGLEVARVGDDGRMAEIKRKVASGKAFGTRARLVDAAEIKERFPLIEEHLVQGGLWDPDAGFGQAFAVANRQILRAAVAVMHQAILAKRLTLMQRLFEGIEHEASLRRARHPPADNAPGKDVDDERDIDEPRPGPHIGQIRHPDPVRCRRAEAALDDASPPRASRSG